jgi:uncharacterized protein YpmB
VVVVGLGVVGVTRMVGLGVVVGFGVVVVVIVAAMATMYHQIENQYLRL